MHESNSPVEIEPLPRPGFRRCVAVLVYLHLVAVGLSLSSSTWPDGPFSGMSDVLAPYLQMTHFDLDDRPISFTAGTDDQAALMLSAIDESERSEPIHLLPYAFPGSGADDRQQRFLAPIALLIAQDQASLVSELLTPIAERAESENQNFNEVFLSDQSYRALWLKLPDGSTLVHQPEQRLRSRSIVP